MGQVIIRNLDDETIVALKLKASLNGQSLEQALRAILSASAKAGTRERLALSDRIRAMTPKKRQSDTTALVREDRDR